MKNTNWFLSSCAAVVLMAGCATQPIASVPTKAEQSAITPRDALNRLIIGNHRFVEGRFVSRNWPEQVKTSADGQYPYAAVVSCLDSRTSPELFFDQGLGDIFCARLAGNIVDDDVLGSLEFACKVSGAKLIAVIGHSNCGAIKGACDDVKLGNLTGLLSQILPAVEAVPTNSLPRTAKNPVFVEQVAEANVKLALMRIRERSPILREMIDRGEVGLIGGIYDLGTGRVSFLPPASANLRLEETKTP